MDAKTLEEHANALSAYLPNGRTFEAKNIDGSNLRDLLVGLAEELKRVQENIGLLESEYLPDKTVLFLDEWEKAVGIPDTCFTGAGTADERRRDILIKFASLGVQTLDDFVALADAFGVAVSLVAGYDVITFPLTFPVMMFNSETDARFTIIVNFTDPDTSRFPLVFPVVFGTKEIAILECLFNKVKPANCQIIFKQV